MVDGDGQGGCWLLRIADEVDEGCAPRGGVSVSVASGIGMRDSAGPLECPECQGRVCQRTERIEAGWMRL